MEILVVLSGFWAAKNKAKQTQLKLTPSTAGGYCWELKKQSQFAMAQMSAKSFEKGYYDKKQPPSAEKNKAKQSQFLYRRADS